MKKLKVLYRTLRKKWAFFWSVNWLKTYYFNYKKFPKAIAKKLPVFIYRGYALTDISGTIIIDGAIEKGMIGFGHQFEAQTKFKGTGEIVIRGTVIFKGYFHFGKDVYFQVGHGALCELGTYSCLGSDVIFICKQQITLGNYVRVAYQTQLLDSVFHQIIDLDTQHKKPMTQSIQIGNYNWIGNRTTVMKGTQTGNFVMIGSNSLLNKEYTSLGEHILLGGIPAKRIQQNVTRDWEGEQAIFDKIVKAPLRGFN